MNLEDFKIDLSPVLGELPARCEPRQLIEIESKCGSISGIIRRFSTVDASFADCGAIIEVLVRAGDPKSHPSRAEIDAAIFEIGIGDVIERLTPFLSRVMSGDPGHAATSIETSIGRPETLN